MELFFVSANDAVQSLTRGQSVSRSHQAFLLLLLLLTASRSRGCG